MTVTVKHSKTNAISDWTQAQLDEQIALGNFAEGTVLADIVLPSDWNDDHTLTGLGTMAEQDANNVAITGGSVNGTTIGATTASTGRFTSVTTPSVTATTNDLTLSAISTGAVKFNTLGGLQAQVINSGDGTRTLNLYGGNSGGTLLPTLFSTVGSMQIAAGASASIRFQTNATSNTDGIEQFRVSHTASAVNYVQVTGSATGAAPIISVQGSDANSELSYRTKGSFNHRFENGSGAINFVVDQTAGSSVVNRNYTAGSLTGIATRFYANGSDTNISMAFQPKGTGAIDLAAGSSGVNISNGGTVTAITRTGAGTGYTSKPTIAISVPTTAGGIQATATINFMSTNATAIVSGGTGYTVGDTLTVVGGTPVASATTMTVSTVSAGVITGVTIANFGSYSTLPTNPVSVTGGTGTGATFNLTYSIGNAFTFTNAGSGYIEQPTITFSGGGGSGAAAFASVGTASVIKAIGASTERSLVFQGLNGFNILELDGTSTNTTAESIRIQPSPFGRTNIVAVGGANSQMWLSASGSGYINFCTSGTSLTSQMRVTHTASAVNYVQVTGSTTGNFTAISAQGSDTNVSLSYISKGTGQHIFATNSSSGNGQFRVLHTAGTIANYGTVTGNVAGSAPVFSVAGTDTNIDLALTPKGTGVVRFGTYTANMALTVQGYIEIKDSGGTLRKLAVIA